MKKVVVRIFLLLFIAGILVWLIPSTAGFINLSESRVHELPQWLKDAPTSTRAAVILITVQLPYILIGLALLREFFKPNLSLSYNRDKFLTFITIILFATSGYTIIWLGLLRGFPGGIYDTMFYGFGFSVLFLLTIQKYSAWMKMLLWTRLIEVWGPLFGYTALPAAFGRYTGGAFGHFGYGLQGMVTSPFFWTDFIVQIVSGLGVMYLLSKAGFKWFWIISFTIGAIITGLTLTYIIPAFF